MPIRPDPAAWPSRWFPITMTVGSCLFIVALIASAIAVPSLRPLHALQALIYVAIVVGAWRGDPWVLGAGMLVPLVWNCLELFGPHLIQAGVRVIWSFLQSGQVHRLDTMFVPVGGLGHCILIVACVIALYQMRPSKQVVWLRAAAGAIVSAAYFALIVAVAAPR